MRPTFVAFGKGALTFPPPTKLRRAAELLERKHGASQAGREAIARTAALEWLHRKWQEPSFAGPSRLVARGLSSLYARPPADLRGDEERMSLLAIIGAHLDAFTLRALWSLWQLDEPSLGVVADRIDEIVGEHRAVERLARRLPRWARDAHFDFASPIRGIVSWIEQSELTLTDLTPQVLHLNLGVGLGARLLTTLVRTANGRWWERHVPEDVRSWASARAVAIRIAVAERQLIELGRGANSVADVPRTEEATRVKTWVLRELGEPEQRPGAWRDVEPRAIQIFEWMLLWDQLALIFDEFAKSAEDDRASFWRGYLPYVRDARFYQAYDTAVCMLAFDKVLVVEFGNTGNATYLYGRPRISLRRVPLPHGRSAGHFKMANGLNFAGIQSEYLGRMSHVGSWQHSFRRKLEQFDLVKTRRETREAPTSSQSGDPRSHATRSQSSSRDMMSDFLMRRCERIILDALPPGSSQTIAELRSRCSGGPSKDLEDAAFDAALDGLERSSSILRIGRNESDVVFRLR